MALLEAEVMEPRLQVAFSRGLVPPDLVANMGLVRLLLERADLLSRNALDVMIADTTQYGAVYSSSTFTDRALTEHAA